MKNNECCTSTKNLNLWTTSYLIWIQWRLTYKISAVELQQICSWDGLSAVSQESFVFSLFLPFSPKLTVIVVKKRVGARFFAEIGGGLRNPPPGTVVDTVVTRPEWWVPAQVKPFLRENTSSITCTVKTKCENTLHTCVARGLEEMNS